MRVKAPGSAFGAAAGGQSPCVLVGGRGELNILLNSSDAAVCCGVGGGGGAAGVPDDDALNRRVNSPGPLTLGSSDGGGVDACEGGAAFCPA
jgi:hypothetical protein